MSQVIIGSGGLLSVKARPLSGYAINWRWKIDLLND